MMKMLLIWCKLTGTIVHAYLNQMESMWQLIVNVAVILIQIQSVLILDSVNNTDSGEYICRAFNNPLCYVEEKIKLTVECEFIHRSINAIVILIKNLCMYVSTYVCSNSLGT